jgi:hypothetical protein
MKESALEARLLKAVKAFGGYAIKLPALWYTGIPDRMLLLPKGRVVFVELKTDKGKISSAQLNWGLRLEGLGLTYIKISGLSQLERFINEQLPGLPNCYPDSRTGHAE